MKLEIYAAVPLLTFGLLANPTFAQTCGRLCNSSFIERAQPRLQHC